MHSEFSENILSDSPTEIDERRQAVVNQTRIAAKVLDALLDASSAWSLKALDHREPQIEIVEYHSMETSEDSEDSSLAPPKRKKQKKSNKKKETGKSESRRAKAASTSSVYKKSLEKMREGETKGQEKKKKSSRLLRFRKKHP